MKIKFKNLGSDFWPEETKLYQVNKPFMGVFLENETFVKAGICKPNAFKLLSFEIQAPNSPGKFSLDFQLGFSQ